MVEPERAAIGMLVTVRKRPIVVGGQPYASRPYKGAITGLDPKGKGAHVRHPSGREHFAAWEEMTPRRRREGEEAQR